MLINDSSLLYILIGPSYACFNTEVKNLIPSNNGSGNPAQVDDEESAWGLALGTGIQKQLTDCIRLFASYQYTNYGRANLGNIQQNPNVDRELKRREAVLDDSA